MAFRPSKALTLFILMFLGLLTASLSSSALAAVSLTAEVDRTELSTDETFTLTIRYTGNRSERLDISSLRNDFDVLSNYENNSYSMIGNRITGFKEWTFILQPKKEGRLVIPSFKMGSHISDAIEVNVSKPVYSPSQTGQDVFIETIVDKSTAYVQEQILIKFRLYYSVQIDLQDVDDLVIDNTVLEILENVQYQTKLNNKAYHVAEFTYAAFPQSSGELLIPSTHWNIRAARTRANYVPGMGRYEIKRLRTEEKSILVKPTPPEFPSDATWLPANDITIEERWSNNPEALTAGTPVTRTLTVKSKGLLARQLPLMIEASNASAMSVYPETPATSEKKANLGVSSERTETMAIVLNEAGEQTIPAVQIPWWDTDEDVVKYAEIPARTINVAASEQLKTEEANKAIAAEQLLQPHSSSSSQTTLIWLRFWQVWAVLMTIASLVLLILWRKAVHIKGAGRTALNEGKTPLGDKQAFSLLKKYCRENNPAQTRQHLLLWASKYWRHNPPLTLSDIAQRSGDPSLSAELALLDEILYKNMGEGVWNGQNLLNSLLKWLEHDTSQAPKKGNGLAPLYPN